MKYKLNKKYKFLTILIFFLIIDKVFNNFSQKNIYVTRYEESIEDENENDNLDTPSINFNYDFNFTNSNPITMEFDFNYMNNIERYYMFAMKIFNTLKLELDFYYKEQTSYKFNDLFHKTK